MKLNINRFLYSLFCLFFFGNIAYSQCINQNQINKNVICTANYDPVCGCDGVTYSNACVAWYHFGITSYTSGACSGDGGGNNDCTCTADYDPVCGSDGKTYSNSCKADCAGVSWTRGACSDDGGSNDCTCTADYDPVCGSDGKTYSNSCKADCAGVSWTRGACSDNSDCINPGQINTNVNCTANYDPVCGCDGVTYSNSCVAWYHHGVKTYTNGACSGGDGGGNDNCNCTTIYDPVCGSDGKTYSNSCKADCAGVSWTRGACGSNEGTCKCTNQYASYICEDFQSYSTNAYVGPQSSCWTTWNNREGTSQDARVRRSSATGNKYLKIDGNSDVVLSLGDKSSGIWDLEFEIWAYRGEKGYYNIQHNFRANASSQWASNVYFDGYGSGRLQIRGQYYSFSYGTSEWVKVRQRIDMNSDRSTLYIDGRKVRDWRFSDQATITTSGIRRLSAINFYPINSSYTFYIDDVKLQKISSHTTDEEILAESRNGQSQSERDIFQPTIPTPKLVVFPNPAHATVNLDVTDCANKNTTISIHNMMGQMIYQQSYLATDKLESTVNVSNFASGAYVVRVKTGDLILSKRLIIEH